MASDDDVILVSETFTSNKRARTEEVKEPSVTGTGEFALDALQCPICIDLVYDPCIVPCGHEFCLVCIEEVVRSTRHRGCPVCRQNFTAATLGVNRKLKAVVEQLYPKESARRAREAAEDKERMRVERAAREARDAEAREAARAAGHPNNPLGSYRAAMRNALGRDVERLRDVLDAMRRQPALEDIRQSAARAEALRTLEEVRRGVQDRERARRNRPYSEHGRGATGQPIRIERGPPAGPPGPQHMHGPQRAHSSSHQQQQPQPEGAEHRAADRANRLAAVAALANRRRMQLMRMLPPHLAAPLGQRAVHDALEEQRLSADATAGSAAALDHAMHALQRDASQRDLAGEEQGGARVPPSHASAHRFYEPQTSAQNAAGPPDDLDDTWNPMPAGYIDLMPVSRAPAPTAAVPSSPLNALAAVATEVADRSERRRALYRSLDDFDDLFDEEIPFTAQAWSDGHRAGADATTAMPPPPAQAAMEGLVPNPATRGPGVWDADTDPFMPPTMSWVRSSDAGGLMPPMDMPPYLRSSRHRRAAAAQAAQVPAGSAGPHASYNPFEAGPSAAADAGRRIEDQVLPGDMLPAAGWHPSLPPRLARMPSYAQVRASRERAALADAQQQHAQAQAQSWSRQRMEVVGFSDEEGQEVEQLLRPQQQQQQARSSLSADHPSLREMDQAGQDLMQQQHRRTVGPGPMSGLVSRHSAHLDRHPQ